MMTVCVPSVLPCLQVSDSGTFGLEDDFSRYSLNGKLADFKSTNSQSLGQLFVGFLKYFSHDFSYSRDAISVRLGRVINKSVAKAYLGAKNTSTQWVYLSIEEPFDRSNTACAVHDPLVFNRILSVFRTSYQLIRNKCDFDFVSPLMSLQPHPLIPPMMPMVMPTTTFPGNPFVVGNHHSHHSLVPSSQSSRPSSRQSSTASPCFVSNNVPNQPTSRFLSSTQQPKTTNGGLKNGQHTNTRQ